MYAKNLTNRIKTSFTCTASDDAGNPIEGTINLLVDRLSGRKADEQELKTLFTEAEEQQKFEPLIKALVDAQFVASWDVFEDEACQTMQPITVDNILDKPVDFIGGFIEATMTAIFPNLTRASNSPAGSAQTEKSASATKNSSDGTDSALLQDSGV